MKKKTASDKISVQGTEVTVIHREGQDSISLADMLKAKDGDFFISDWLRNRNTEEFLGIWESVHNPGFNSGEFATIKSQAGLNSYKLSVKELVEKTNAIGLQAQAGRYGGTYAHRDIAFEFGMWISPAFKREHGLREGTRLGGEDSRNTRPYRATRLVVTTQGERSTRAQSVTLPQPKPHEPSRDSSASKSLESKGGIVGRRLSSSWNSRRFIPRTAAVCPPEREPRWYREHASSVRTEAEVIELPAPRASTTSSGKSRIICILIFCFGGAAEARSLQRGPGFSSGDFFAPCACRPPIKSLQPGSGLLTREIWAAPQRHNLHLVHLPQRPFNQWLRKPYPGIPHPLNQRRNACDYSLSLGQDQQTQTPDDLDPGSTGRSSSRQVIEKDRATMARSQRNRLGFAGEKACTGSRQLRCCIHPLHSDPSTCANGLLGFHSLNPALSLIHQFSSHGFGYHHMRTKRAHNIEPMDGRKGHQHRRICNATPNAHFGNLPSNGKLSRF
jgi:hypothetical protein